MQTGEISALVKASIEAKILEAFKQTPEYIDALVSAALNQEVNEHGGKPDGYGRHKMPYLTWLVGDQIRAVARAAVIEHIQRMDSQIREAVQQRLTAGDLVDAFAKSIIGATNHDWKVNVQFGKMD